MSASDRRKQARPWIGLLAAVTLLAVGAPPALADVTGAADDLRTAWYPHEPALAPVGLTTARFKKAFDTTLRGQVYAQPLVANGTLLVVTEEDWAYGLDPVTGAIRWERELGALGRVGTAVESGAPTSEATIKCPDIEPRVGVTGTPVIDTAHNVAYFVANSYESGSSGAVAWYVHALTLDRGEERPGFPVKISGNATNLPSVTFEALQQLQRPALLLMNGVVYAAFGSHCDTTPYEGWIIGVSTGTAQVVTKWAAASGGAAIWQSGGGLLSDGSGQILFASGNGGSPLGTLDPPVGPGNQASPSPEGRLGESVVRVEAQEGGELETKDYFSPFNSKELDEKDLDIGSWAPVGLPSPYFGTPEIPNLLVQEGKQGTLYLLNRDALGGHTEEASKENKVVQEITGVVPNGVWGTAAAWPGEGGYLVTPSAGAHMKIFKYDALAGKFSTEPIVSADEMEFGSGSPIVTSDGVGAGTGTAWIVWCPAPAKPKACEGTDELRAYNPATAKLLWHEQIGFASKFSRPGVNDGHVYVGNREGHLIAFSGPALRSSTEGVELAVPVGEHTSREVTFENTGSENEVKATMVPAAPFEVIGVPRVGVKLQPGEVVKATVIFKPSAPGRASAAFSIATAAGEIRVALTGVGQEKAAAFGPGPGPGSGPPLLALRLSNLRIRTAGSHLSSLPRRLVVTYLLSRNASVRLAIFRRVVSHHCARHARSCVRWVATRIRETVAGHGGANTHAIDLGALRGGRYRLAATPFTKTVTTAATVYVYFKASHKPSKGR